LVQGGSQEEAVAGELGAVSNEKKGCQYTLFVDVTVLVFAVRSPVGSEFMEWGIYDTTLNLELIAAK